MSKLKKLEDVLLEELKDLYSAEKQLLKALPKMKKAASNESLQEAFSGHLVQTEKHCERLTEIEAMIGSKLSGKTCKAMKGLVEEGEDVIKEKCDNESLQDALLIGAARRVEHYEVAAYCTARAMASELGLTKIEKLLGQTFEEESEADEKLSAILTTEILPECSESAEPESKSKATSKKTSSMRQPALMLGLLALSFTGTSLAYAEQHNGEKEQNSASAYEADNTGKNLRDQRDYSKTADSQDLSDDSANVLATIRKEVLNIENLSVNGQNIKILLTDETVTERGTVTQDDTVTQKGTVTQREDVTQRGTVTLRGPVESESEKVQIENTVQRVASSYHIDNQLEVTSN